MEKRRITRDEEAHWRFGGSVEMRRLIGESVALYLEMRRLTADSEAQ